MNKERALEMAEAGTGFMLPLAGAIRRFEEKGYTENLVAKYDHFECQNGKVRLFSKDIKIDSVMRFENSSDPDDQAILYAICAPNLKVKGLYAESYGLYHEELAPEIIAHLKSDRG